MDSQLKEYVSPSNMAHPDFPEMGLGDVAYVRKVFQSNHFVYLMSAANGETLMQDESWDNIQDFATEYSLELITLH